MHPMEDHPGGRRWGSRHHHPRGGHPFPPEGGPHRHRGRGRAPRGDVRTAVLLLLAEEPMHGYQLMQAIAERSGGRWRPSPGAIYPTINQLEDEGLVTVTADAGRKLVTLTDAGRQHLEARGEAGDPFSGYRSAGPGTDLRGLTEQLAGAVGILAEARRSLYLLLADGPEAPESPASGA
jgi:DNA-binding PadR family transcriptional regulator